MTSTVSSPKRWIVLAMVIVATTIGMMSFAAPFALLPVWIRELGLSKAQAGLLSGLWYLPGIVVALPAGWAFDRYPPRRIMLGLWLLIVAGMACMAISTSFVALCLGRLLFSTGMNAHMVGAPKILGNWFAGRRELGLVMGLYTLAFTSGIFVSLRLLGPVAERSGSAPAVQMLAATTLAGLLLVAAIPGAPDHAIASPASATAVQRQTFAPWSLGVGTWLLALAYFGYSIGTEAYLTFTPDLLVGRGIPVGAAAEAVGSYAIVAVILKPILSAFLTRERARWFTAMAVTAALLSVLLLFVNAPPGVSAAAMGVSLALGMPSLMALPNFVLPAARAGQAYGLYQLLYSLGFLAQPLVGATVDWTGSYAAGYAVVAVYLVIGYAVLLPYVRTLRATDVADAAGVPTR